jgi:hypothetical protein
VAVDSGVLPARYAGARLIGHGGMGEIYFAEDRDLGREVAIKLLDERLAGNQDLRRRFGREALAAARLSGHPHVVTIYDVGDCHGRPFIVMEYLPGGTLGDRARSGPVARENALAWLGQAGEALDAAHELGIVHRDVKPANLLLDARGQVAVADFGIARIADDTSAMTAAGTVIGTAGYLAPEQALGDAATPASDRYALAVVAYALLTGGRPFERGSTTAEAAAHIHEPVPPASQRGVGLPRALDAVFERALAKNPAERYASAAEFVQDLAGVLMPPDEATRQIPVQSAAGLPVPAARPAATRRRPSPLFPLLLAALVLALIGGAAAAVFATSSGGAGATAPDRGAAPPPNEVTVTKKETKTVAGEAVTETVVTTVVAEAPPPPSEGPVSVEEAVALTDRSTDALRRGDWTEAAELARRAYPALRGTYSEDFPYEAYVNYDLGKALAELGGCEQAVRYLDRSEDLQGHRSEIDDARAQCAAA